VGGGCCARGVASCEGMLDLEPTHGRGSRQGFYGLPVSESQHGHAVHCQDTVTWDTTAPYNSTCLHIVNRKNVYKFII